MLLPMDRLIKGIIYNISNVILPEVSSPYARSIAIGVVSVLNSVTVKTANLYERLSEQNDSLRNILKRMTEIISTHKNVFDSEGLRKLGEEIGRELQKRTDTGESIAEVNNNLKLLLEKIIEVLWELEEHYGIAPLKELHKSILLFLRQEVETEFSLSSFSGLVEILKGK